jgi:hypothetical protein
MSFFLPFGSGENKKIDTKAVKDFIIGTTHNINKKILELEDKYNIHIKLRPLLKNVEDIQEQNEETFVFPMAFQNKPIKVNTGYRGTIPGFDLNTISPSFDGSFFNDFINGVDGENYKERFDKIKKYLEIYIKVKKQLEAWKAGGKKDADKKNVDSTYVEFLPDDNKINKWEILDIDKESDSSEIINFVKDKKYIISAPTPASASTSTSAFAAATSTSTSTLTKDKALNKCKQYADLYNTLIKKSTHSEEDKKDIQNIIIVIEAYLKLFVKELNTDEKKSLNELLFKYKNIKV